MLYSPHLLLCPALCPALSAPLHASLTSPVCISAIVKMYWEIKTATQVALHCFCLVVVCPTQLGGGRGSSAFVLLYTARCGQYFLHPVHTLLAGRLKKRDRTTTPQHQHQIQNKRLRIIAVALSVQTWWTIRGIKKTGRTNSRNKGITRLFFVSFVLKT